MNGQRKRTAAALVTTSALLVVAALAAFAGNGSAAAQVAPRNEAPPTIAGTPQEGQTLTANPGSWSGTQPITFAYQWQRCGRNGGNCANIIGAASRTYTLRGVDVGNTLRVRVTARNQDGSVNATSVPTAVVTRASAPARGCAAAAPLQVAAISAPDRLNVNQGSISPGIVRRSTRTVTLRFQVTCAGKPVQGALVYATAVPFNQFTIPAEQATGADGFATLVMTQLSGFPAARNQQLLVVFARARKPGENALGGISTRRLVSFPVDLR